MIIYEKYVGNRQFCWYDSSNVIYSECYDKEGPTKNVKVVFKNGGTYLYKDVLNDDYIQFRSAESNGKAVNSILKKYQFTRLTDTKIEDLDAKKQDFINENVEIQETTVSNLIYRVAYDDNTGEFGLYMNDKLIYHSIEGNVSIVNLFKSMSLNFSLTEMTEEEKKEINGNKEDK